MNEEIKKEAIKIMDEFMDSLSGIDVEESYLNKRKKSYREEKEEKVDSDFKNIFLKNARRISGDAILAEKGEWTK